VSCEATNAFFVSDDLARGLCWHGLVCETRTAIASPPRGIAREERPPPPGLPELRGEGLWRLPFSSHTPGRVTTRVRSPGLAPVWPCFVVNFGAAWVVISPGRVGRRAVANFGPALDLIVTLLSAWRSGMARSRVELFEQIRQDWRTPDGADNIAIPG
jgi:hypothetical protein